MFEDFNNLTDKELIEEVKKALNVKDLQLLADNLSIPRPTIAKWSSSGTISKNGTGRQYLIMVLKFKKIEKDLESFKKIVNIDTCNKAIDIINLLKEDIIKSQD